MDGFKKLESYINEETENNIEEFRKLINNNDIIGFNKLSERVKNSALCKYIVEELERRDNDELLKELQDIDEYIADKVIQDCNRCKRCENCKWKINDICVPCEYFRVTNQILDMMGLKSQLPINLL